MKKSIIILILFCATLSAQAQNTTENTPNRGEEPCARPQIETNPFEPKNTEWFSMQNRFNWMDYVTNHNGVKKKLKSLNNNFIANI